MGFSDTSFDDDVQSRILFIQEIVEDVLRRREAGEAISDEELIAAHPELMPELGEQLRLLGVIHSARQKADKTQDYHDALASDEALPVPLLETARSDGDGIPGYEILDRIHAGGQGVVYKAIQKATKRTVAVKMLLKGPHASPRERFYFEREVELAANLHHKHIVTVYESGVSQGRYYCAMEYIDGRPLDRYVRSANLNCRQIMGLFAKVCEAAAYAHQRGIIHRDLKPNNILVDAEGEPHILDFGLAKYAQSQRESPMASVAVSASGQLIGTLAYMSPEQASGHSASLDVRSDVYSLGVILYQLLTERFPYEVRGSTLTILRNIQEAEPDRPSRITSLDSDVEAIVLKALAKDPVERYQSAAELHYDIECWLNGLPIVARSTSSLYLLRKLIVKHRYASTVAALLVIIVAGFGYVSLELYLQARKANAESVRSEQANLASRTERDELATFATAERAAAMRQAAIVGILLDWNRGMVTQARRTAATLPPDSREALAAGFLLDPRSLPQKQGEFRLRVGESQSAFADYFIGEHCLRDGNLAEASAVFRRTANASNREWYVARAKAQLEILTTAPGASIRPSQGLLKDK